MVDVSRIPLNNKNNRRRSAVTTPDGYDEMYASPGGRIMGWVVIVICLLVIIDVVVQFRSWPGLVLVLAMSALGYGCYLGLIRPAVLMGPPGLLIRNMIRDRYIPWQHVTGAKVRDVLEVEVDGVPVRAPAVQLVIRDLRRAARRREQVTESSAVYTEAVLERIDNNRERYTPEATGDVVVVWQKAAAYVWVGLVVAAVVLGLIAV